MNKLIECVKNNDGVGAMLVLDDKANSFSFFRQVPEIVASMRTECFHNSYIFCAAIVKLLAEKEAKHGPEERMEYCMRTAEKIVGDVLPGIVSPEIIEWQTAVDKNWLHPTVFQQIAQVPFLFFNSEGLREKHNFDNDWWRCPLI
jgi:hypothetical protein